MFDNAYSIEEVAATLRKHNEAVWWFFPDDSLKILGLEVDGISVPASSGIRLHNGSHPS
jgi:hypothetical protein